VGQFERQIPPAAKSRDSIRAVCGTAEAVPFQNKNQAYGAAEEAAEKPAFICAASPTAIKPRLLLRDLRCGWKPHPFKPDLNRSFSGL
jgi:hypothetical protein